MLLLPYSLINLYFWIIFNVAIPPPHQPNSPLTSLDNLSVDGHAWSHPSSSSSLTCYLSLVTISMQKNQEIVSFHRYEWSKNPAIWLGESILALPCEAEFFQIGVCSRKQRIAKSFISGYFQRHVMTKLYENQAFLPIIGQFFKKNSLL